MLETINPFVYARPLDPIKDKNISIIRKAKTNEVILGLEKGDYFALLAPNHTGKTTFIYQVMEKIKQALSGKYRCLYINFKGIEHYSLEIFFQHLAQYIILRIQKEGWGGISGGTHIKNAGHFGHFLEIIASKVDFNLIFFLDEVEILPKELVRELLFVLRTRYIESTINQKFRKTTVLVSGTVDLLELTTGEDTKTAPFNIAKQITLSDFQEEEVLIFIQKLEQLGIVINTNCINKLYEATKGQPYLVQKICYLVVELAKEKLKKEKKEITLEEFNKCIEQISEEENESFAYLTLKLEQELENDLELLNILENLLYSTEDTYIIGKWDTSFKKLELAGVIVREGNKIRIKNPIYEKILKRHFTKAYFARIYFAKEKWGKATQDFKEHLDKISHEELKTSAEISQMQVGLITRTNTLLLKKLPLDKILDMILESIVQCFGFERSYLYLIDRKEEKLICNKIVDSKNQISTQVLNLKDSLYHIYLKGDTTSHLTTVILEQEEYLNPEISAEAKTDPYLKQHFGEKGSVLAIPLMNEDKSIGILGVYNKKPIKEEERNLISSLTNQIALVIKNDTLCKRLHLLNEIAGIIASNAEISTILNSIIKKILEGIDSSEIGLFEIKDKVLKLKENIDWGQKNEYKVGKGIIGLVAKSGKPNKVSLPNEEVLAVPLKFETQVIGVLGVRSILPNSFNTDDIEFLSTCAEQIVMAINKDKYFEKIGGKKQ